MYEGDCIPCNQTYEKCEVCTALNCVKWIDGYVLHYLNRPICQNIYPNCLTCYPDQCYSCL